VVVAFEPRSLSAARREFQDGYCRALASADAVLVAAPHHLRRLAPEERLDRGAMADALVQSGVRAFMPAAGDDPVDQILELVRPGDVVLGCSSGDFAGFHRRLLAALGGRAAGNLQPHPAGEAER
jgi:UDP-N-acetylmuramate: L-alanyl-gamma-D-glutamyl-meso-diaminopimelate ligase